VGGARLFVKGYCRIILFAILTKNNGMGCWECNTYGGEERCIEDFGDETRG